MYSYFRVNIRNMKFFFKIPDESYCRKKKKKTLIFKSQKEFIKSYSSQHLLWKNGLKNKFIMMQITWSAHPTNHSHSQQILKPHKSLQHLTVQGVKDNGLLLKRVYKLSSPAARKVFESVKCGRNKMHQLASCSLIWIIPVKGVTDNQFFHWQLPWEMFHPNLFCGLDCHFEFNQAGTHDFRKTRKRHLSLYFLDFFN